MLFTLILVVVVLGVAPRADAFDLHTYWDGRCSDCHGHAGAFARQFLSVRNGKLQGRHHVENLSLFLSNHYVSSDLVEPVTAMLLAQITTPPRFQEECGRCHQSAASLARESLMLKDGALTLRKTGNPVAVFLRGHARTRPEDVSFFVDVLTRVTIETGNDK